MFDDIPRPTCRSVYTVSDKHLRHGGSGYETTYQQGMGSLFVTAFCHGYLTSSTKRSIVSPLISLTAIQVTFVAKRTGNCFLNMGRYCTKKGPALFLQQCICTTQLAIIHDTRF